MDERVGQSPLIGFQSWHCARLPRRMARLSEAKATAKGKLTTWVRGATPVHKAQVLDARELVGVVRDEREVASAGNGR